MAAARERRPPGEAMSTLEIGGTVSHYRIEAKLGQGGMGEVYRAADLKLGRPVALKVLPPEATRDPGARDRFLQEARFASVLNHPHIVTIYEVDESDGFDFIAMELVEGETLRAKARRAPIDVPELVEIAIQCAEALGAAHAIGLIHRDIKPANILVTPKGQAKVLDFGLAKRMEETAPEDAGATMEVALTSPGVVMGTLGYMSPEQARGEALDPRTDIFSLGCTLYEAATGKIPFEGSSTTAVLHATWTQEATPPSKVRPDLPIDLDAILGRAMAKDRDDRYASARELADALASLREGSDLRSGTVMLPRERLKQGPNNLPASLTTFIGRKRERAEIGRLLQQTRLVTLTGPGGCGKTRLAIQVATDALSEVPDGAWIAELAPLSDPALVPQTVAGVLGVREEVGKPLQATLAEALATKRILLVLDNCEHVAAACAALAGALLPACRELRIVATSQEPLGVPGEVLWRIPMLGVPDVGVPGSRSREAIGRYESVKLFVDRATAVMPSFQLTDANAPVVALICRRVDGIPLAIELAAARVKVLAPDQILARLEDRFKLLTGGSRTALPKQQTLRAAVDWSYDLLAPPERSLLNRLSVFAGGFTLEAVERVCADETLDALDVLDMVARLVDRSLVVTEEEPDGQIRYRLLETIRDYGREKLEGSGERPAVRERHAAYYLALAVRAEPELSGPEQGVWLDRLEREHDNLRQALALFEETRDAARGLCLGGSLWRFWWVRGNWAEGRKRLAAQLDIPAAGSAPKERIQALFGAGVLAFGVKDYPAATALMGEGLAAARMGGDTLGIARCLFGLANIASDQDDYETARPLYEEVLPLWRELGHKPGLSGTLHNLGVLSEVARDYERAEALYAEGLSINREIGNRAAEASSLNGLGGVAYYRGKLPEALGHHERALGIQRELGDSRGTATSLRELGEVSVAMGNLPAARAFLRESLGIYHDLGDRQGVASVMEGCSSLSAASGAPERALRLAGAAAALREAIHSPLSVPDRERLERYLAPARKDVGDGVERDAASRVLPLDDAVTLASDAIGNQHLKSEAT
ncbi:MAG TPA: tetratricopeptide repeat protein [Candidatus Eisenbacteria bacterium]